MKLCEGVIKFIKLTCWSKEFMDLSLAICGSSLLDSHVNEQFNRQFKINWTTPCLANSSLI